MALRDLAAVVLTYTVVVGGVLSALVAAVGWRASYPPGLVAAILFGIGNVGIVVLFSSSELMVESAGTATAARATRDDPAHVKLRRAVGQTELGLVLLGPGVYGLLGFVTLSLLV